MNNSSIVSQCNLLLLGCRIAPPSEANNKLLCNRLKGFEASGKVIGFISATDKINRKGISHKDFKGDLVSIHKKRGARVF